MDYAVRARDGMRASVTSACSTRDSVEQVQAAVGYYAEFSDEVDAWLRRNREEAERLEARWKREQAALRR